MEIEESSIQDAAETLRRGDLVAFPTETVYGLGADAGNPHAVSKIFALKQRPANHPLIVHIASPQDIHTWGREIPDIAETLIEHFWPGPLTLIVRRGLTPTAVTGGQDSVGIRMPSHPVALALLRAFGGAVAAPTAYRFGRISPTQSSHVKAEFGSSLNTILEGGNCAVGLESSILSLIEDPPRLLRPGHVRRSALEAVLGRPIAEGPAEGSTLRASGLLASHYAPETRLVVSSKTNLGNFLRAPHDPKIKVVFVGLEQTTDTLLPDHWIKVSMPNDPERYGQQIYALLRTLDEADFDLILLEKPPETEHWKAINDRLTRASHTN